MGSLVRLKTETDKRGNLEAAMDERLDLDRPEADSRLRSLAHEQRCKLRDKSQY